MIEALKTFAINCGDSTFLGFPAWHNGLTKVQDTMPDPLDPSKRVLVESCSIQMDSLGQIWTIVANVTRAALAVAGFVAVVFIIVGGFQYITSGGNPEKTQKALSVLTNAVVGLLIAIFASAIVGFVASRF